MHRDTCGLTPLPDVDVNPLQDFVYPDEFSPVSSPEFTHKEEKNKHHLTDILRAFNTLFERDFDYEEAVRSASPKSGNLAVSFDEHFREYTKVEAARREPLPSCVTAPIWNPSEVIRASEAPGASSGSSPASWDVPVCEASSARTAKRQAPNEAQEMIPRKRKRVTSPPGFSSSSPDTTSASALRSSRDPPESSSLSRPETELSKQRTRRIRYNLRERQRSKGLTDAFSTLREVLPLPNESKNTKLQTLRAASHYIQFLHDVYAASAYELIHGQVPKETKCGVRYALSGFKRKSIRKVFSGNSEVLSCAFNLWIRENEFDDEMTVLRPNSCGCGDTNPSPLSSPTISSPTISAYPSTISSPTISAYPSTISSLLSPTLSPVPSPMVSSCSPTPITLSPSVNEPHLQQKPGPWTWDY